MILCIFYYYCSLSHSLLHIPTHTYTNTHTYTYIHTYAHTLTHTYTHTCIHTCTFPHTLTLFHSYTLLRTHLHTYTCIHTGPSLSDRPALALDPDRVSDCLSAVAAQAQRAATKVRTAGARAETVKGVCRVSVKREVSVH